MKKVLLIFNEDYTGEKIVLTSLTDIEQHIIENGLRVKIYDLVRSDLKISLSITSGNNTKEKVQQQEREEEKQKAQPDIEKTTSTTVIPKDFNIPD